MIDIYQDLNINYLKIFVCVANTGSFKKTSQKLAISQPSITYSIKNLESYYNVKLFNRKADGVTLTQSGEILLEMSKEIFTKIEECNYAMNKIDVNYENINIGMPSHIFLFLKHHIFNFIKQNPNIKISFSNDGTTALLNKIKNDELDVIIDTAPIIVNKNNFTIKRISEERMCFVCSTKHKKNFVINNSLVDILKNPIILPGEESSIRQGLQNLLNQNDILFTPAYECPTTEIMIEFIKNGFAIGYVFESSVIDFVENNTFTKIDLDFDLPKIPLCIVEKKRGLKSTAYKFIKYIKKECSNE